MDFVAGPHQVFHHDTGDSYVDALHQHHHYVNPALQDPNQPGYYNPNVPHQMSCDIKPRLTKEQHDILEAHYQKQSKPNTNTKKGFAESLNVSLDKVNNWFQNRRAKAKQDAKKQAGAFNLFTQQQQPSLTSLNFNSDSEPSPAFSSAEYYSMMQSCSSDDQMSTGVDMDQAQQYQDQSSDETGDAPQEEQFNNFGLSQHLSADMFESPQELNRRTMTQEQFDAYAHSSGMMQDGRFDAFHNAFSGDSDVLHQVYPEMNGNRFKQQQDSFSFPVPIVAPMGSNDSSVPSSISESSMFPSSTAGQDHPNTSATSSEWADSRSSSVSVGPHQDSMFHPVSAPSQPAPLISSKWQPGQSVPVDPNALQQHFREVSQRQAQQQQHQQQQAHQEQPLAWPADEAYVRRESQGQNMLAQQMSSFAIQTPQPPQSASFKCPPPPGESSSSIAARRQRPRPAALGLASLRSQSYSGAAQPASPNNTQSQSLAPGQQLRRIRSSNVLNAVAQGRVMKSTPGSAQRSPLSWTFADAMNSPKTARHASTGSSGNLAPPTPLSPTESQALRQASQFPPWQSSGHFSRQESISETDAEHNIPAMSTAGVQQKTTTTTTSSPPQTPMYHHHQQFPQQFGLHRVGSTVITENTPPQSAPACQQTFPSDVFAMPQQQQMQQQGSSQHANGFVAQQQSFVNVSVPEQQFQMIPNYYSVPITEAQPQAAMHFANGVPMVNAQGNLTMAFPPQMQQLQFIQHPSQMAPQPTQGQGQMDFMSISTAISAPAMQITAQLPKQQQPASEFFVHEYSPPQDMKRSATVRKVPADSGPKNYTFANQGPEHFEGKSRKAQDTKPATTPSSSPASAASSS